MSASVLFPPSRLPWVAAALALLPAAALAAADVTVVSVNAPEDATTGSPVALVATLRNAGTVALSGWELGLYLSPDNAVSVFDRRLAVLAGPDLAPGETVELPLETTLPGDVALGTYTFGVIADPMNTLGEPVSTLLDNVRSASRPTQVKAPSPDFVAVEVRWPQRAAAGEATPVRFTVENRGVLAGEALAVFHLSTNDNVTAADPQVGQQRVALEAGERQDIVAWVRLPAGIAASRYHLGVILDPQNELRELQEGNNVAVSASGEVIAASLVIESSFLHDALVGTPYVRGLVASGGDGPYVWRLVGGAFPEGLRLSEDGIVTGTTTTPGVFSPVVEVASGGRAVRAAFILRAYVPTTSLSVLTEELPPAVAQATYEAPLAAAGGTPPYLWRLSAGTLPSGLELLPDGRITGKARTAAATPAAFTAEVKDVAGTTHRRALSLKTLAAGDLAIRQLVLDDAAAGEAYLARIEPSGGTRPYRWAIASGQLPAGMAIASEGDNLTVAGRPLATGLFVFSLRVEDASGQADRNTYALRVGPSALEIRSTELPDADRGQPYDAELTATSSTATWRLLSGELPPGMELTRDGHVRATDGVVPDHAPSRTFTFSVEVADGKGGVGRTGLSLTVRKVDDAATEDGGCAQAAPSWFALLALVALLLPRRRVAGLVAALGLAAPPASAQGFEYFVAGQAEQYASPACTHRCSGGTLWLDDVSLTLPDATELVANGAFANAADDLATSPGWQQVYDTAVPLSDEVTCAYDTTGGHAGTSGLKCRFPAQHVANADSVKLVSAPFDLAAGVEHVLSYCAKGDVDGQELVVRFVDEAGAVVGTPERIVVQAGTFGCTNTTVTPEASVTNARLELLLGDASALTGTLTFTGGFFGSATDDGESSVVLPFDFPFFDTSHRIANVSTNGYLSFVSTATAYSGQSFPSSSSPNGVIAAWWEDLKVESPGLARWFVLGDAPHRAFVVEWKDVVALGDTNRFSFQVRLEEDGTFSLAYGDRGSASLGPAALGAESASGHAGVNALPCRAACGSSDYPTNRRLLFTRQVELLVASVASPQLAWAGLPAPFEVIVQNVGALPAEVVRTRLYLSRDTRLDPETDPLLFERGPVALEAGHEQRYAEQALVLPADLEEGLWYPIAVVDPDDEVDEALEANNVKTGDPVRIGTPGPDFVAAHVSFTGARGTGGDAIPFVVRVGNVGNRAGLAPWRVVLSTNDVVTVSDRTVSDGAVQLAAGATEEVSGSFTLPADLVSGIYRVGLVVDAPEEATAQVPELNEFDNTSRAEGTLTMTGPLSILTTTLPDGASGVSYSVRLRAAGGDGLLLWGLADGSGLPQGLALSPLGTLEGIPVSAGTTTFTVTATSGTETLQQELSLYVAPVKLPLSFVSTQLPAAIFGREYEARLSAHGGVPPYVFRIDPAADVDWPQGVAFDASGLIGGVPVEGGDWELPFIVEDRLGGTATRTLVLHVLPPGRPVIDARPLEDALLDESYEARLSALGGRPPYRWNIEKVRRLGTAAEGTVDLDTTLPGLALVADGILTGTPAELGLYAISMLVTDAGGATDRDTVLLEVRSERGLAVLTGQLPDATTGRDYEEQIVATGGSGQLTFSLFDGAQLLPEGLALREDGTLVGRPGVVGRRTFLVRVVDAARRSDVRAVTIAVKNAASRADEQSCSTAGLTAFALLGLLALLRRRRGPVAGLALAAGLAACGAESPPPPTLCDDVLCQPGEECDLDDGICKCGGAQGRACTSEERCNAQSLTCELLDRCKLVQCTRGMSCDRADGECKCGVELCEEGEACDAATQRCVTQDLCALVSCTGGASCDPADGACKCGGAGGLTCGAGEICKAGICKADLCASVACTGGTTCDPEDGRCRCGGAGGEFCLYGQTCLPDSGRCVASSRCATVRCAGGSSCDPADGACKCGGAGGPTCEAGQTCEPDTKRCIGGNRCRNVTCAGGAVCDPEDGLCHCGTGGPVCGEDEACEATASSGLCRALCEPVSQSPCAAEETCAVTTGGAAICSTPGAKGEGVACTVTNECGRGMHCVRGLSSGACRYYCAAQDGLCSGTNRACRTFSGAPTGVYACQPCLSTDTNCNR